jgi:SAM-dependent methyltransferase
MVPGMAAADESYTHGHHESVLRSHRWRTAANSAGYLLPLLRPGHDVLDVGCGPGTITLDLARTVAPGLVLGVDPAEEPLGPARAQAASEGLTSVSFEVGDVYALDLADDSFDVVHAHQVLQHLADPVEALREMRRVCRPGGLVAARDADYAAMTWHPADDRLQRWLGLYSAVTRGNGGEPNAGRQLRSWAIEAGFSEVTSTASVWCFADTAERDWWSSLWADRITVSRLAEQAVERGLATSDELARLAAAWREWGARDDAWFAVPARRDPLPGLRDRADAPAFATARRTTWAGSRGLRLRIRRTRRHGWPRSSGSCKPSWITSASSTSSRRTPRSWSSFARAS